MFEVEHLSLQKIQYSLFRLRGLQRRRLDKQDGRKTLADKVELPENTSSDPVSASVLVCSSFCGSVRVSLSQRVCGVSCEFHASSVFLQRCFISLFVVWLSW